MEMQELQDRFQLVSDLLKTKAPRNEALEEFRQLMDKDYMDYTKVDDALAEEAVNLKALQGISNDLEIFIRYEQIYSKNIIALGGGFSSGKSAFCNSLFASDEIKLPTGINPVTAIPAYVVAGEKPDAFGITSKGGVVPLGVNTYKKMDHAFLKSFDFNLKNLLPSVIINAKMSDAYDHICFIDTPGYNPADTDDSFTGGDRATSLEFIRQAKGLFWFIGVDSTGTLPDSDIDFLNEIFANDPDKKLYVICNKADLKSLDDIESILDEVGDILDDNEIPYDGIVAYSARCKMSYGFRKMELKDFIAAQNTINSDKKKDLQKRLKDVFRKHIAADNDRIHTSLEKSQKLNKIILHFNSIMENVEMKLNADNTKKRRDAIAKGTAYNKSEDVDNSESIGFILQELSSLKYNLELDVQLYKQNLAQVQMLRDKMQQVIDKIFVNMGDAENEAFVNIPKQQFEMGCAEGNKDEQPGHSVMLNAFNMKTTLVTQKEWKDVLGVDSGPSFFKGDKLPVENISFLDAIDFCNAWSVKDGLVPCYKKEKRIVLCDFNATGYRLPTEAEWECAAALDDAKNISEYAWFKENSNLQTQEVAIKVENAYGLYDMIGNVAEWCFDAYSTNYYEKSPAESPCCSEAADERVIRGGSWNSNAKMCRRTARNCLDMTDKNRYTGFRVVRKDKT